LCRASTSWRHSSKKEVDGGVKPGHDEKAVCFQVVSESPKMLDALLVIPWAPLRNASSSGA
jgi:hypothetical protein